MFDLSTFSQISTPSKLSTLCNLSNLSHLCLICLSFNLLNLSHGSKLFIYLSIGLSIFLPIHLCICLSIYFLRTPWGGCCALPPTPSSFFFGNLPLYLAVCRSIFFFLSISISIPIICFSFPVHLFCTFFHLSAHLANHILSDVFSSAHISLCCFLSIYVSGSFCLHSFVSPCLPIYFFFLQNLLFEYLVWSCLILFFAS